jgi:Flp pilus assembly protein TadG
MRALLHRLLRNRDGIAYIEFAIIAPVLMLMYCGSYVVSDMVTCGRKVSLTAHTITDLTSQYGSISTTQVTAVFTNAMYVLAPYNAGNATMRISEIQVTDASHASVVWSEVVTGTPSSSNTIATGLAAGTVVTLPTNLAPPLMVPSSSNNNTGAYFIMGEISYPYTPLFGSSWLPSPTLYNRYFMLPRLTSSIALTSS